MTFFNKTIFSILFFLTFSVSSFSQQNIFDIARTGTLKDIQKAAIKNPESINTKNENGYTPLILACYRGNIAVAKFLIQYSKTVNVASDMGTPLMAATYKGQTEIVKLLLENKADPNIADGNGTTPLIYCAMFGHTEILKLLLDNKANKTHKDKDGKTAFEFAVFSGNQDIINQLKI
jgi:uncharacterized protein